VVQRVEVRVVILELVVGLRVWGRVGYSVIMAVTLMIPVVLQAVV
jgi:hypothetical protein